MRYHPEGYPEHNPPDCYNHDLNVWCGLHGDPDDIVACPPDHYRKEAEDEG